MATPRKPESEKKKAGRKSLYKPEFNDQVYKLCLLGATDEEIADFFNVSVSTINNWKNEYPEFLESIKKGKIIADAEVAASLFKRATGFEYKEVKSVPTVEGDNKKMVVKEVVVKYIAPDPTSMIFWLKNRQKSKWRDRHDHEHTGKDGEPMQHQITDLSTLTDEQLARLETIAIAGNAKGDQSGES